eukprot:933227-Prymnesium_polylepis.3
MQTPFNVAVCAPAGVQLLYFVVPTPAAAVRHTYRAGEAAGAATPARGSVSFARHKLDLIEAAATDRATRVRVNEKLADKIDCRGDFMYACVEAFGCRCEDGKYVLCDDPKYNRFARARSEVRAELGAKHQAELAAREQHFQL